MRHRKDHRKLSRTASHRRAVLRNLVTALFRHERIETTVAKAKETKKITDSMVALALRGDVHARRQARRLLTDPAVVKRLFTEVAPKYQRGRGGYTRVIRTRTRRGDASDMAIVELVS